MSNADNTVKKYKHSELLYNILPSVYRERDSHEDLKKFLNGSGVLLDQLHSTLLQRYADIFPDSDTAFDINSQAWLLPYIADLLDVRMASPTEDGQREEISNAISWRKAKGTVSVVEAIAEKVGGMEVVVHEGWKRIATTARIGMPILPIESYGYQSNATNRDYEKHFTKQKKSDWAPLWARHPGLPAGTVDMRCQGGAVKADEHNSAAVISKLSDNKYRWRQSSLHGAQSCHKDHSLLPMNDQQTDWIPGYFDDPSVRTVDFRNSDWRKGHFHPKQVLLFTATHPGFFSDVSSQRSFTWSESLFSDENFLKVMSVQIIASKVVIRNKSLDGTKFQPVKIRQRVMLEQVVSGTGPVNPSIWRFEGIIFSHTIEVDSGRLELDRCAVLAAEVHSTDLKIPVLTAEHCLLKRVQAATGLVSLQYCTVMTTTIAENLQASGCIFNGLIRRHHGIDSLPGEGCVRYSSILPEQSCGDITYFQHQKLQAVFNSMQYGQPGCAVLHPATSEEIAAGTEDGGEMGAYHHLYLLARRKAVIKKLADFLPVGMKAVVIPDNSLNDLPGKISD